MSDQTYRTPITTSAATAVVAHQQQNNQSANEQDNKSHDLSDEGHWEEEEEDEGEGTAEGWRAIVRLVSSALTPALSHYTPPPLKL